MKKIIQLYPEYEAFDSVYGLYLNEDFPAEKTFIYGSFLSSIDGRIAIGSGANSRIPDRLLNTHDFRLFLELQAYTDCMVTHGGYLRARAAGTLDDILHLGRRTESNDLMQWRQQRGLTSSCAVIICSTSLQFPEPTDLDKDQVIIVTAEQSDAQRIDEWRNKGYRVEIGGKQSVEGGTLVPLLEKAGYRRIFLVAGPKLFTSMLNAKRLNRLYLTVSQQFLGSSSFHTLTEGRCDDLSHCHLNQTRLIYDNSDALTYPQWYSCFDVDYR